MKSRIPSITRLAVGLVLFTLLLYTWLLSGIGGTPEAASEVARLNREATVQCPPCAAAPPAPAVAAPPADPSSVLVRKTVESDTMRLVFVAGIEGTGHHALCSWMKSYSPLDTADGDRLARAMGKWFFSKSLADHESGLVELRRHLTTLRELAEQKPASDGSAVHIISPCSYTTGLVASGGGPGMMSYPNFAGNNRMVNQPNVRALAQLAESVGIDLRVIVLVRAPVASIASTAIHQHTGYKSADRSRLPVQVKTLSHALASLDFQVRTLDPAFYVVSSYEELVMGEAENILPVSRHAGITDDKAMSSWLASRRQSTTDWTAQLTPQERAFISEHFLQYHASSLFQGREGLLATL